MAGSVPTARDLTELAAEQQRLFDACTSPKERKQRGHFGTPSAIAGFMAGMFDEIPRQTVRVVDPGAGVGMLSAALCQRVLRESTVRRLVFELWENDPKLEPYLCQTMEGCRRALQLAGHDFEFTIHVEDFVLAHTARTLFETGPVPSFDLAVMNPPYYKLRKDSKHARAMAHVVHGQPNIYSLFMAAAADLLVPGGQMVAITPRSYFNGPYFKRFRKWFFDRTIAKQIHVFESRTDAFKGDEVLQENVILLAKKGGTPTSVVLTSSVGRELDVVERRTVLYPKVIDDASGDHVIRVTTNRIEQEIVEVMDRLPRRFRNLGFEISTGPVVTFRSTGLLRSERAKGTAPLLWMHNVRPFTTRFPPKNGKPLHILINEESKRLLLPARRYVLLKRFTSKEEHRRLVAGIFEAEDSYSEFVGLENHLNYVYRRDAELSKHEALGLAAFFNSALVDRYFRAVSGNTQVNASEIRSMPFPEIETVRQIGCALDRGEDRTLAGLEQTVGNAIGLPPRLIQRFCGLDNG